MSLRKFACEECGAEFMKRAHLLDHAVTHSKIRAFACSYPDCEKTYLRRDHLRRHIRSFHEKETKEEFKCQECNMLFAYKHGLKRHMEKQHPPKVKKRARTKRALWKDEGKESKKKEYICRHCNKNFSRRYNLTRHELSCTAKRGLYICGEPDCISRFKTKEEVLKHMQDVHSKGFSCDICSKMFEAKKHLQRHLRIHNKSVGSRKIHKCPEAGCGRVYTASNNLSVHMQVAHGTPRVFVCDRPNCGQTFAYKHVLERHIANVHDKPREILKPLAIILGRSRYETIVGNDSTQPEKEPTEEIIYI